MKNYLTTPFGEMISTTRNAAGDLDINGKSQKIGIKSILSQNKKSFTWVLFQVMILLFMFSSAQAQIVEDLDIYMNNADAREAQHLNMLVNDSPSSLFIYNQTIEVDGEAPILLADVNINSIEELYVDHAEFENVQLIRIKVRNPDHLNFVLDLERLKSFENLRYIFVVVTYEMCPAGGRMYECEKTKIRRLFSTSENNSSFNIQNEGDQKPVVLFKVVRLS